MSILALVAISAPGCGCPKTPEQPPTEPSAPLPADPEPAAEESPEESKSESEPMPEEEVSAKTTEQSESEQSESASEGAGEGDSKPTDSEPKDSKTPSPDSSPASSGEAASPGAEAGANGATGAGAAGGGAQGNPASTAGNGTGGLPGGKSTPPNKKTTGDPQVARKTGREQLAAADKAAAQGDHAQAFQDAVRGWQAVAPFTNDAESRRLTAELRKRMEKFGTKANAGVSTDSSKTLIVE